MRGLRLAAVAPAAAVSGDSTMLIQGTAGTSEEQLPYGWNYAELLAHGPSDRALVPSLLVNVMRLGKIARIEELTHNGISDGLGASA